MVEKYREIFLEGLLSGFFLLIREEKHGEIYGEGFSKERSYSS